METTQFSGQENANHRIDPQPHPHPHTTHWKLPIEHAACPSGHRNGPAFRATSQHATAPSYCNLMRREQGTGKTSPPESRVQTEDNGSELHSTRSRTRGQAAGSNALTSGPGAPARLVLPPPPRRERRQPEQRRQHHGGAEQHRGRAAPPPAAAAPLLARRFLPRALRAASSSRVRRVPRRFAHHPADPLTVLVLPPARPLRARTRTNEWLGFPPLVALGLALAPPMGFARGGDVEWSGCVRECWRAREKTERGAARDRRSAAAASGCSGTTAS